MTNTKYTVAASIEEKTGIDLLVVRNAQGERVGQVRYPGGLHLGSDPARVLAAVSSIIPRSKVEQHCGRLMYVIPAADTSNA
jgi:hypothetical protein